MGISPLTDLVPATNIQTSPTLVSISGKHPVKKANSLPSKRYNQANRVFLVLVALLSLLAPSVFLTAALAQTEQPPVAQQTGGDPGAGALSSGARRTEDTSHLFPDEPPTNLVIQAAEQNKDVVIQEVEDLLTDNFKQYNETWAGLHTFWGEDVVSNLFANIGQLIGKWLTEFINGWVADTVQFLTGFLRIFVLNPNVAVNGLSNVPGAGPADDISPFIRQGADVMYGIAVDLLLLLFILCIWKYWAEAAWRGGGNLMGSVGRMIFTAGLMLAWPTIYAFEIQITNEMIKALYFNSADQVASLDAAMAAAVKGGLLAGAGLIANATAPIAGQAFGGLLGAGPGGIALGTVGSLVAFAGLIIYLVLGGILIAELIYILVLKAIQTALLTAQYMFAPVFIVFFATPDTENVTAGFVRSFVEVSLWTFVWVGLLKILVIMVLSDFNPWGKIILAVGILQMMIQVPSFLARAQISPMSDFVSAGLITGGLLSGGKALGNMLGTRGMQLANYIGGDTREGAARGMDPRRVENMNNVAGVRDPKLLNDIRSASKGELGGGGDGKALKVGDPKDPKGGGGQDALNKGKVPAGVNADSKKPGGLRPPKRPGEDGTGANAATNNPAADASKTGKTGDFSQAAADSAKKAARNAGLGAAVGLGTAALAANQGMRPPGTGGDTSDAAKKAQADAARADLSAKQMQNMVNSGAVELGDKEDKEKGIDPKLAQGKDLDSGNKDKDKDKARTGVGADAAKTAAGLVPPGSGAGAKTKTDGKDSGTVTPVDKQVKTAGDPSKTGAQFGPPGAKELAAMADKTDKGADGAGGLGGDKDGKPITVESEEDATARAVAAGLNLAPGAKFTAGKGGKAGDATGKGGEKIDSGSKVPGVGGDPGLPKLDVAQKPPGKESVHPTARHSDATTSQLRNETASPANMRSPDPLTGIGTPDAPDQSIATAQNTSLPKPPGKDGAIRNDQTADLAGQNLTPGTADSRTKVNLTPENGGAKPSGVTEGNATVLTPPGSGAGNQTANANLGTVTPGNAEAHNAIGMPGISIPLAVRPGIGPTAHKPGDTEFKHDGHGSGVGQTGPRTQVNLSPDASARPHQGINQVSATTGHAPMAPGNGSIVPPPPGGGNGGGGGGDLTPPSGGPGGPHGLPAHGELPPSTYKERLDQTQAVDPFKAYQQAGYRWIPPRGISGAIRLAQNVTLGPSLNGGAQLIGDGKGATYHVRTGEGMSNDQVALQMMSAGYASNVGTDPHAFAAARQSAIDAGEDGPKGMAQRMAAGILSYHGRSWSQTARAKQNFQQSMYSHAVQGSAAYVNGQPGNAYTEYLSERYGPMTAQQQAFGVHLMTDTSSPESSWHWAHIPATETLVKNSIPINATSRAFAANPNVFRARPWEQRAAIAGGVQYMESRKATELPEGTPGMVADAWVGREAQLISPAVVNTLSSLTSVLGEDSCKDVATVNNVANIVGAGQDQSAYVQAYTALKNVQSVGQAAISRSSSFTSPPTPGSGGRPMGPGPGGYSGGGGYVGPGPSSGGGMQDHVVEVQQDDQGGSYIPTTFAPPPPGSGMVAPPQTNIAYRAVPGAPPPRTQHSHSMRVPTQGSSGPGQINQSTTFSGAAGQPIVNEQQVDLEFDHKGGSTAQPIDPSQLRVPSMQPPRQESVVRVDVSGNAPAQQSGSSAPQNMSFEAPLRDHNPHQTAQLGSYQDPSASAQTVVQNVKAELLHSRSGFGGIDPDDIHRDVQNLVGSYNNDTAQMAYHVVYDLASKGFSYEQLSDKSIAQVAMQVHAQDPSMVPAAAIAANAMSMNPQEYSVERVHTVQAMMEADPKWNSHNIDDKSVYAAEAIMRVHSDFREELTHGGSISHPIEDIKPYPTKDFVDRVALHPEFVPRAASSGQGYHQSVVNQIRKRMLDRIAGRDQNYGGIYDRGAEANA